MITVVGTVAFDSIGLARRLPSPDEAVELSSLREEPGGCAGNVAHGLARLGADVTLRASVGPDFADSDYEKMLMFEQVRLDLYRSTLPTARAMLVGDGAGHQQIYFHAGASKDTSRLHPVSAGLAHFAAGEFSAYPWLMRDCKTVSFDPGQELLHASLRDVETCFQYVHYLFVNEHEMAHLERGLGLTVAKLLERVKEALIVTHGAKGALIHTKKGDIRVPSVKADVVDPTGAGDAHRVGFLYGLENKYGMEICGRLGSTVASFVLEGAGAQANLPTLGEARERYAEAFGEELPSGRP
ncbi:MAG: carbohydrate kinase family protein [Euryarchaeota archaeon]|nr:carbohydrate kinase family protein [Euryarchaeota archaeon]